MTLKKSKYFLTAILILSLGTLAFAQKKEEKEIRDASDRAQQAAKVFNRIMADADKSIPRELLERAEAVAVFPGVLKAAFIVGGRGGEGVISRRTALGWSAPAFFKLGGGSFGVQIGAEKTDYIMLFMNDGGLRGLLEDKFEFGGEVGVAAGPIGRTASATTNATLDAGILSYSRSKGAFIGAAFKGGVISPDNDKNRALYQKTSKQILLSNDLIPVPEGVRAFPQTLNNYSTRRGTKLTADTKERARTVGSQNATTATGGESDDTFYAMRTTRRPATRLAREVRSELLMLPNYDVFDWLEFQVSPEDNIVLRGWVTRPSLKTDAEEAVKNIDGVTGLRNDIEVLPLLRSDDELRQALYRAVYSGQNSRYAVGAQQSIHILVKNGAVTLKGVVANETDRNYAGEQAGGVAGVTEIKNELFVENSAGNP